jgi:nucleoside-diphosphate-sugar epimerase
MSEEGNLIDMVETNRDKVGQGDTGWRTPAVPGTPGKTSGLAELGADIPANPSPVASISREDIRNKRLEKMLQKPESHNVLILGAANQFASHICTRLLYYDKKGINTDAENHLYLCDFKDSHLVFLNPDMQQYQDSERIHFLQHSIHDWDWIKDALETVDTVINCSYVHDTVYAFNNPVDTAERNSVYAIKLMDSLRKHDFGGRIIHISTDKVYGKYLPKDLPLKENVELRPEGVRATTRAAQELAVTGLAKSYGIQYMILRMGTIFGEFTPANKAIYHWCKELLMGEPISMYGSFGKDNSPSRDWVDVWDASTVVSNAVMARWDLSMQNEIYNIGGCDTREKYLQNIAESLKATIRTKSATQRLPWRNREEEKDLHIWMDCNKAANKLAYYPIKDFAYGSTRGMARWVAKMDLGWNALQMLELERQLGQFDRTREIEALKEINRYYREHNMPPISYQTLMEEHSNMYGEAPGEFAKKVGPKKAD